MKLGFAASLILATAIFVHRWPSSNETSLGIPTSLIDANIGVQRAPKTSSSSARNAGHKSDVHALNSKTSCHSDKWHNVVHHGPNGIKLTGGILKSEYSSTVKYPCCDTYLDYTVEDSKGLARIYCFPDHRKYPTCVMDSSQTTRDPHQDWFFCCKRYRLTSTLVNGTNVYNCVKNKKCSKPGQLTRDVVTYDYYPCCPPGLFNYKEMLRDVIICTGCAEKKAKLRYVGQECCDRKLGFIKSGQHMVCDDCVKRNEARTTTSGSFSFMPCCEGLYCVKTGRGEHQCKDRCYKEKEECFYRFSTVASYHGGCCGGLRCVPRYTKVNHVLNGQHCSRCLKNGAPCYNGQSCCSNFCSSFKCEDAPKNATITSR